MYICMRILHTHTHTRSRRREMRRSRRRKRVRERDRIFHGHVQGLFYMHTHTHTHTQTQTYTHTHTHTHTSHGHVQALGRALATQGFESLAAPISKVSALVHLKYKVTLQWLLRIIYMPAWPRPSLEMEEILTRQCTSIYTLYNFTISWHFRIFACHSLGQLMQHLGVFALVQCACGILNVSGFMV